MVQVEGSASSSRWFYWRQVLHFLARNDSAEWTVIGDEQLFVAVNSLNRLIARFDSARPLLMGRSISVKSVLSLLFPLNQGQNALDISSGIVISKNALDSMGTEGQTTCSGWLFPRSADKALGACADQLNIPVIDPVDADGRPLFYPDSPRNLITAPTSWRVYVRGPVNSTCCSDRAVTFARVSYREQRMLSYLINSIKVFGAL